MPGGHDGKPAWNAPESWKVRSSEATLDSSTKKSAVGRSLTLASTSTSSSDVSVDITPGASSAALSSTGHHRHHTTELKGAARSSVRVFKGEKSSVLPCTLQTTCSDMVDILLRKRFLKSDEDHIIVLQCGGLIRTLSWDERPLQIQRSLLFLYGYTSRDNLDYIERTDLSFLFKFIVQDRGVEQISDAKRTLIDPQNVNLVNWNVKDIPNFLYAEPIVSLDVSQNPSFEFTEEFMHDCRNLSTLKFTRSGNPTFPSAVVLPPRLETLDLQVNYIRLIPPEISQLQNLTTLNMACNRLSSLPDAFAKLPKLQDLNLSSNRFKSVPVQLFNVTTLKKLDLSYNNISVLTEQLASLNNLQVLVLAANKLTGPLPEWFSTYQNLIKVDFRFNRLSSIDSLQSSPKLEEIRVNGNNISVFNSQAKNLFEIEMSLNPLTSISFNEPMPNLKYVNLSKGRLTTCPFVSMLTGVEKLVLDNNHLRSLPNDICKMQNLSYLSAYKNSLDSLPDTIGSLKKLKFLDVHLNNITHLRDTVWFLDSLETLNMSSNSLKSFPDPPDPNDRRSIKSDPTEDDDRAQSPMSIHSIEGRFKIETSLKFLSLNDNKLSDTVSVIPKIALFQNLQSLNLSYNDISDIIPGYLSKLRHLKGLYLSGNYLRTLPVDDLDSFKEMTTLYLNGNRFNTLPAELGRISNLTALDVGSNLLKYNIGNIPYDWNWCYNKKLKYLNFSGNKRLEIKQQQRRDDTDERLDSFAGLKDLVVLGLMDVTITTDTIPDQSVDMRVRSTSSQLGKFGYGIADTLGYRNVLSTRDIVREKFRGNSDEMLITIYDGKNSPQTHGDKISKIMQETFDFHLKKELETVGTVVMAGNTPKSIEDCMRGAFLSMNSEMSILINKDESSTFSSAAAHRTTTTDELNLEEDGLSGCCSTLIYIKGDEMYLVNLGDTMGVLTTSDGGYKVVTTKHEPYAPEEYDRIRQAGGYVTTNGNLDGISDVSRAVGYFKLIPHITSKPSVQKIKLTPNEEMICIATSDIWKEVPYGLAADIIRGEKSDPGAAAEQLRDYAISYGAKDKCTAVVLSLQQFTSKVKYHERSTQLEDSTLRKLDDEIKPPTGEVAMAFTDIKNSTLLWDTYPVAMRSAIKVHNTIMRRQLRIIGGYEVKTEGDAFMVSFPNITSALLWCFTVQDQLVSTDEWPAEILDSNQGCEIRDKDENIIFRGLSVRMGVHIGYPVCEPDIITHRMDYFGPMVNRASRVSAVADGGQITMSNDFYTEFHKILDTHESIKAGRLTIEGAYGSKSRGQVIENQLQQLEQIGWVEKSIGSKKLKGLETPESIFLIYPRPLRARMQVLSTGQEGGIENKTPRLTNTGLSTVNVWQLRKLALRLERVCNFLAAQQTMSADANTIENFYESFGGNRTQMNLKTQNYTNVLLEHTITRIENCVMTLTVRRGLSGSNFSGSSLSKLPPDELYHTLASLLRELTELRNLEQKTH